MLLIRRILLFGFTFNAVVVVIVVVVVANITSATFGCKTCCINTVVLVGFFTTVMIAVANATSTSTATIS